MDTIIVSSHNTHLYNKDDVPINHSTYPIGLKIKSCFKNVPFFVENHYTNVYSIVVITKINIHFSPISYDCENLLIFYFHVLN